MFPGKGGWALLFGRIQLKPPCGPATTWKALITIAEYLAEGRAFLRRSCMSRSSFSIV
jgi:hypothetical protein